MRLNPGQQQAVEFVTGPCLVLAGAGSGKTRVITNKIAHLIRGCGYQARHIAAVTFTNKAAREMKERVGQTLGRKEARGLMISTFHTLGLDIIKREYAALGMKSNFSLFDDTDQVALLKELTEGLIEDDKVVLQQLISTISNWKNDLMDPAQAAVSAKGERDRIFAHCYSLYHDHLKACNVLDFDDLILLPTLLLQRNEEVRERWQNKIRYLLVDEYQDTNVCQYRLVQLLTGSRAMFTAVGDDDQAIYAWRGATIENLAKLTTDYPNIKLIKLEQNYRSVQRILAAANAVIEKNPKLFDKKLWSDLGVGEPILVSAMDGEEQEAESIAMKVSASRFERQAQWKDFAILYRSNHQSRILEQALRNLKIPYTISGGQSFFDKAEVRDVLSYLRLLANDDDDPAFIRAATTPKRGIGQATLQVLGQYAATRETSLLAAVAETGLESLLAPRQLEPLRTFAEFIRRMQWRAGRGATGKDAAPAEPAGVILDDLVEAIQYERHLFELFEERPAQTRWQNVLELTGWLKRKAEEDNMTLFDLVQHVALVTMLERGEEDEPDAVKMSTLHASKGLEYPHVYLAGVEEGLLPHLGKDDEVGDPARAAENLATRIQEERRLMYVGITRAQRSLNLSWCKRRRRAREDLVREPSRFIEEMGLGDVRVQEDEATAAMNPKERMAMLKALLKK